MQPVIINVALLLVKEEIANILEACPYYPYQKAFSEPNLQLSLLAYVLNQVPGIYVVVDREFDYSSYPASSSRMLDIETAIHKGIKYLVSTKKLTKCPSCTCFLFAAK